MAQDQSPQVSRTKEEIQVLKHFMTKIKIQALSRTPGIPGLAGYPGTGCLTEIDID